MKPIKLEIEGLHSFASKQTIDFASLTSRGVFGIFGATGSGKSTILDAIILALYGKVYRSKSNSDFINLKSKSAKVGFQFSFVDDGKEKTLYVVRTFKRKPKNANEVDQQAEVYEVGALGSRQIAEGVKRVDEYIVNLLGMTDTEFLKCIALPQGEFASFLKSKPNERVSIIGNIFDLNKYGQELWEKVKIRLENIEKEKAVLEGKLLVVGSIDESAVKAARNDIKNCENDIREMEESLEKLNKTEKEEREVARLGQELDNVNETLKKCEDIAKSITIKKDTLKKAKKYNSNKFVFERTENLLGIIMNEDDEIFRKSEALKNIKQRYQKFSEEKSSEIKTLKVKKAESISKIERLKSLISVEARLKENKNILTTKSQDLMISGNKIESLSKNITAAKVERGLLTSELLDVDNNIESLKEEMKSLESVLTYRELSSFIEELKRYKSYLEEKYESAIAVMTVSIDEQEKINESKKRIQNSLRELYEKYKVKTSTDEIKLNQVVEDVYEEIVKFQELKYKLKDLTKSRLEVATKIAKEESKCKKFEDDKVKLDLKLNGLVSEISEIKSKIQELIKQKELVISNNGVGRFIETVKIGDECPICKNEVLVKGFAETIDTMLIDNQIEELNEVLGRKETQKENLIYSIAKSIVNIENQNEVISALNEEQSAYKVQVFKLFNLDENASVLDEEDELAQMEAYYKDKLDGVKKALKRERLLLNKLKNANESLIKQNCIGASARLEVESIGELLSAVTESVKKKDISLLSILSNDKDIQDKISRLEKVNSDLENKMSEKEKLNEKLMGVDSKLSKLEMELALEKKENSDLKQKIIDVDELCKSDQILINAETISGNIEKTIELENKELAGYEFRECELKDLEAEQLEEVNTKKVELEALISANKAHKDEHKNLAENVINLLKDLGVSNIQDSKLYRMEESEISLLESSIENYDKDYIFAKTRKKELETHLNGRVSSFIILDQIAKQIEQINKDLRNKKDKLIELSLTVSQMDEKLKIANEYSLQLDKVNVEYDMVKELYDLLKGKALLEFIAEEFINDISFMASNKLQTMMDGRYILKYQNKEFVVVDNFNDAIERPVSTLSGGELFVVSLALALSISDAVSSKSNKSIDFFFLDEGFGTLDKEYCEYIVDSLIRLESQNLTIGLISHIPELQEKIIQKLEVVKTESGTIVNHVTAI